MKKLSLLCILCLILCTLSRGQTNSNRQSNASITLIIKNSPEQLFILRSSRQGLGYDIIDSAMLGKNGGIDSLTYDLSIEGRECHLGLIFSEKKPERFIPVIAPGEHLKITIDFNKLNAITYDGSARTREFLQYWNTIMAIGPNYADYKIALNNHSKDSVILKHKLDSIDNLKRTFIRKTIFNTDCAYVVVLALMESQGGVVAYTQEEFTKLKEKFKDDNPTLQQININERLQIHPFNTKPKPANGTHLAGFTLPDKDGKLVSLSQFKGKYVLVDFWASWCAPCRKESPYLKRALQRFGNNNFVILSVSIDKSLDDWEKAIIKDGTQSFVHLIDIRGGESPVTNQYNIETIPGNFLIDPTGKVIDKDLRGEKLIAKIAELIQEKNGKK
ncbi:TlpA family protein disulfide reductase [Mucilaginibacter ginsenosidivorans]|uniref:TlpA family protein disulfide reductase n=1 Tax=Mucilaginibacter ginsenosidivorans TaxID=398053 RepID=A0A5B8URZ7_9SPHI|nr:TlpA disulfide reductase family protein [Mucilaginibacter ginsenosidivorans]QEC61672.1 TlpA family protein disulfide reductase [Mucilaginibacter ginsenosidivorans]